LVLGAIIGIIALFSLASFAFAWTEPTESPPEGNVPPPLNRGSSSNPWQVQYTWDKIGIGTSSPSYYLHVYGSGESTIGIQSTADQSLDSNDLRFWVNGDYRLVVDSSGKVGIGTTSPSETLTVAGNVGLRSGALWQPVYPSDDGLVLYLPFSEGTGTKTYDRSPYGNDGTIYGAAWTDGKYGNALSFDGEDDYVDLQMKVDFPLGSGRTLMAWVNFNDVDNPHVVLGSDSINFCMLRYDKDYWKSFFSRLYDGSVVIYVGAPNADLYNQNGRWYHMSFVVDRKNTHKMYLFIDGDLVDSRDIPTDFGTVNRNIYIGGKTNSWYMNGTIDEVRIYNRALSGR